WNGGHPAPRAEFWGGELTDNDVKRIVTKSGHRIQLVDKKGKEAIVIATPTRLKISLIEKTDENNRSVITMHSEDGDIYLSAPNGQIHLRTKHFTRETSGSRKPEGADPCHSRRIRKLPRRLTREQTRACPSPVRRSR